MYSGPKNIHEAKKYETNLLIIYTGGTFGMRVDDKTDALIPFSFQDISKQIPQVCRFNSKIDVCTMVNILDSSNMGPQEWLNINEIIQDYYLEYDAFIILHGTDTMAYTASALSFLLKGIQKPVILTGAQLPIGFIRNDARENFITTVQIAHDIISNGIPLKEVAICFDNILIRGNRATKIESEEFAAFESHNYPVLAEVGVKIKYFENRFFKSEKEDFFDQLSTDKIGVLKFHPGISSIVIDTIFNSEHFDEVVIESYGAGNIPINTDFEKKLDEFLEKGGRVYNVSQCIGGVVAQKMYQTGYRLEEKGVLGLADMTLEATLTKLMYIKAKSPEKVKKIMIENICGEQTV